MEKQTQKNNTADFAVLNESTIKAIDLLQEIEPLIKEYFILDCHLEKTALKLNFKNGQQFRIIAEEVKG